MSYAATTSTTIKPSFFARVRAFFADAWRVHLEVCEIVAESHRRPFR
ncbi:hypothetical protein [Paraburkholderia sp. C35]|nr:hypothetical protein [Paraburkholderia sp. C35]